MMENEVFEVREHYNERLPESELDCIDEIADLVCLMEGLTNMFMDISEGFGGSDEKERMIKDAYKSIIIRETAWAIKRMETVCNVLYADVRRRGRIRRAARVKKDRRKKGNNISSDFPRPSITSPCTGET